MVVKQLIKAFFLLLLLSIDTSFEKNSVPNFSVHPKGPKSKMAAKMAAVTLRNSMFWYLSSYTQ